MASGRLPFLFRVRSSIYFILTTSGLGLFVDLLVYSCIIPIVPFILIDEFGYTDAEASSKGGILLAIYSIGLLVSSGVFGILADKWGSKKELLLIGQFFLIGSSIVFMLAKTYWLLAIARVLQGFSGGAIWVLGLTLVADSSPKEKIVTYNSYVTLAYNAGLLVGPVIGGILYGNFGRHVPFIVCIVLAFVDLIMRMLLIEKHESDKYLGIINIDPQSEIGNKNNDVEVGSNSEKKNIAESSGNSDENNAKSDGNSVKHTANFDKNNENFIQDNIGASIDRSPSPSNGQSVTCCFFTRAPTPTNGKSISTSRKDYWSLLTSPRLLGNCYAAFIIATFIGAMDPTLPIYLHDIYGYSSTQAGLIYLAMVIPAFITSPIAGILSDGKLGVKWTTLLNALIAFPFTILLILPKKPEPGQSNVSSVVQFVAFLAINGGFGSAILAPLLGDMSKTCYIITGKASNGFGYALFNIAFSLGAFTGPLVGGTLFNIYGWNSTVIFCSSAVATTLPFIILFIGGRLRISSHKFIVDTKST